MTFLQPGSKIGKYPIVRLIAAGGMGMLYEALHPVLGFRVAIKTIRPDLAHDRTVIDRFLKEAISACRVRDERLPSIHDHDKLPDGSPYMVMEFLEGEDLGHRLTRGALEPAVAARLMVEVLEVLDKVHRLGIIHRDIKPQNIFLARSALAGEVPKLLDFGVAHIASDAMTRPGEVMGTPLYMALEQADGKAQVGPWTDVFSAGVVLYECLAGPGVRPWGAIAPLVYLNRLSLGAPPIPIEQVAPETPPGLAAAVMRALTVDVEGRWPDAASFAQAIEPFAQPRQLVFGRGQVIEQRPQPPADPSAETVVGPTTQRRPSQGLSPDAVSRLRSRIAGIGRRRRGRDTERRLRSGARRHVALLALSFELTPVHDEVSLDPEAVDAVLHDIVTVLDQVIDEAGGRIDQQFARTLLATFGHDRTREDDAERAALAALRLVEQRRAIEDALADFGYAVTLRIGLHSGFILHDPNAGARTMAPVAGDTATVVRFLEASAPLNGIYASREVREAGGVRFKWRALGAHPLRGRSEAVEIHELLGFADVAHWSRGEARPFVGRTAQLAQLMSICAATDTRSALIVGQPGFGKTRLLEEALRRLAAQTDPPRIVYAVPELEQPYGVWVRVLDQLMPQRFSAFDVDGPLGRLGVDAARHGPVVRLLLGDQQIAPAQIGAPDVLKARITESLLEIISAASTAAQSETGRALIIALDGLHRADEASLGLLSALPERIHDRLAPLLRPVLLVAARSGDVPSLGAISSHEIALGTLSVDAVERLARSLVPERHFSDAAVRLIRDRAGGSPLFVEELVTSLAEDELNAADTLVLAGFRVPGSLYGMLLARLERLPQRLRDAARHLSVFGERIWPAVWDGIAGALSQQSKTTTPSTARAELNALADAGILEWRPEAGELCFFFRQQLLREAIYATVLPENRRLLHRLIAEALVKQPEEHRLAPQILHHFHQAGAIAETVDFARRVGRRALEIGAFEEAGRALQLATRLQKRVTGSTPEANARTLLDLSWTQVYLGRLRDAADSGRDAAVSAADNGLPGLAGAAHFACAQAALLRNETEEALTELEMAEHLFDQAGNVVGAARARSAQGFVLRSMGQPEEGLPLVEDAWTVLRVEGKRSAVLRAAHDFGNVLLELRRAPDALAVFDEAVALAAARGEAALPGPAEAWVEPAVRSARAIVCAQLGRVDEAIREQTAVYEQGLAQGNRITQTLSSFHLANHLLAAGRLDDAEACAERAMDLAGTAGMPARAIRARVILASVARARDDLEGAIEHLSAGEFLARTTVNQEGGAADGLWLKLARPLGEALTELGDAAALDALRTEGARRLRAGGDPLVRGWLATLEGG